MAAVSVEKVDCDSAFEFFLNHRVSSIFGVAHFIDTANKRPLESGMAYEVAARLLSQSRPTTVVKPLRARPGSPPRDRFLPSIVLTRDFTPVSGDPLHRMSMGMRILYGAATVSGGVGHLRTLRTQVKVESGEPGNPIDLSLVPAFIAPKKFWFSSVLTNYSDLADAITRAVLAFHSELVCIGNDRFESTLVIPLPGNFSDYPSCDMIWLVRCIMDRYSSSCRDSGPRISKVVVCSSGQKNVAHRLDEETKRLVASHIISSFEDRITERDARSVVLPRLSAFWDALMMHTPLIPLTHERRLDHEDLAEKVTALPEWRADTDLEAHLKALQAILDVIDKTIAAENERKKDKKDSYLDFLSVLALELRSRCILVRRKMVSSSYTQTSPIKIPSRGSYCTTTGSPPRTNDAHPVAAVDDLFLQRRQTQPQPSATRSLSQFFAGGSHDAMPEDQSDRPVSYPPSKTIRIGHSVAGSSKSCFKHVRRVSSLTAEEDRGFIGVSTLEEGSVPSGAFVLCDLDGDCKPEARSLKIHHSTISGKTPDSSSFAVQDEEVVFR